MRIMARYFGEYCFGDPGGEMVGRLEDCGAVVSKLESIIDGCILIRCDW